MMLDLNYVGPEFSKYDSHRAIFEELPFELDTFFIFWSLSFQSLELTIFIYSPCSEDGQEKTNEEAPENNPQYTTVYVGNLAPEVGIDVFYSHF